MSLTALLEAGCTPPERGGSLPSVASKPASSVAHDGARWVYHPHLAMSLAAPGLELRDGNCLLTTAVGRWLVRPATPNALTLPGPVLANDEPRLVCMGTAEFLPGVVPGIPIKSAAHGAEVAYLTSTGVHRSTTPAGPIAADAVPEAFVDIAGTSDRLAGVGRSGRVYARERSGWEKLDALADVVEIAPLGDALVALSIPERYTVLPDTGRKPQPLPTLAEGRGDGAWRPRPMPTSPSRGMTA